MVILHRMLSVNVKNVDVFAVKWYFIIVKLSEVSPMGCKFLLLLLIYF